MDRDGQEFTLEQARAETNLEHPNGTLDFEPIIRTPNENNQNILRSNEIRDTKPLSTSKSKD